MVNLALTSKATLVNYALKTRLGLCYRTPLKSRLVFSEGRNKLGVEFCLHLDETLKQEAAGAAVIVYLDESYCHTNHMPSKCWCGDRAGRVERSRSKVRHTLIHTHSLTLTHSLTHSLTSGQADNYTTRIDKVWMVVQT